MSGPVCHRRSEHSVQIDFQVLEPAAEYRMRVEGMRCLRLQERVWNERWPSKVYLLAESRRGAVRIDTLLYKRGNGRREKLQFDQRRGEVDGGARLRTSVVG